MTVIVSFPPFTPFFLSLYCSSIFLVSVYPEKVRVAKCCCVDDYFILVIGLLSAVLHRLYKGSNVILVSDHSLVSSLLETWNATEIEISTFGRILTPRRPSCESFTRSSPLPLSFSALATFVFQKSLLSSLFPQKGVPASTSKIVVVAIHLKRR